MWQIRQKIVDKENDWFHRSNISNKYHTEDWTINITKTAAMNIEEVGKKEFVDLVLKSRQQAWKWILGYNTVIKCDKDLIEPFLKYSENV